MATRQQIENQIARSAKRYGINRRIFHAQLNQESGLNPNVTSPAGARGVAQFIPSTAKIYGVNLNDGRVADDIDGAARYMRDNLKTFGGSYRKALAAYNAGAGAVQKYGGIPPYSETQAYVKRILQAAGVGDHPSGPSSGAPGPSSAPSAQPATEPATRTETQTAFDAQGYQTAQRRAALGQMIASRNPNSSLLRFGLLSTAEPSRTDFTSTTQVQVPVQRTNASDGHPSRSQSRQQAAPAAGTSADLVKAVKSFDRLAGRIGVPITAKQEPGHQPGGDHDPAVKGATARDFGGSEELRLRLFRQITRRLGVRNAQYKGQDINVTRNGIRYQIISRDHGTGPHLHVGMRYVK